MKKIAKALMKRDRRNELLDDTRENPNLVRQDSSKQTIVMQQQNESWYASLTPKQKRIINGIAISLGISVIAAAFFFLTRGVIRKKLKLKVEDKSLGGDKHATWAKQIKIAFENGGWWGTDEVLLRNVLRAIPSQQDLTRVSNAYRSLTKGGNMVEDMTKELKPSEYEEMLAIIEGKPLKIEDVVPGKPIMDPKGWAKRINAALSYEWLGLFWGTDPEAIKAVYLEIPSRKAYKNTKYWYKRLFGSSMLTDLNSELLTSFTPTIPYSIQLYSQYIKKLPYSIYNNSSSNGTKR